MRRKAATLDSLLDDYARITIPTVKGGATSTYGKQVARDPKRLLPETLRLRPI